LGEQKRLQSSSSYGDEALLQEARVDEAVARVLTNERFRTGLADPLDGQVQPTWGVT